MSLICFLKLTGVKDLTNFNLDTRRFQHLSLLGFNISFAACLYSQLYRFNLRYQLI